MKRAVEDEKKLTAEKYGAENATRLTVSDCGTCKKRGFSSRFSITTLIGNFYLTKSLILWSSRAFASLAMITKIRKEPRSIIFGTLATKKSARIITKEMLDRWRLMP